MEKRQNDLMMNMVANPNFTILDFATIGYKANNTSLLDKTTYKNNPFILELFTDKEGKFDDKTFNDLYNKAVLGYSLLASDDFMKNLEQMISFHRSNIYAPEDKRRSGPDFLKVTVLNPDLIQSSITKLGELGLKTKSTEEIAEGNKVLLNPTEVAKGALALWGEAPDGNFFKYFTDTLVLAQYDLDEVDPITGLTHKKGELKLNEDGSYYYEALDGRDIYGKLVLSKLNILTSEGSLANRFDPFDSDDLLKSIGGTIMKNLFLVGSMFLPWGIGPAIAGASVITLLVGLTGTLGKMLSGSDSPTLSAMEGWAKGFNRQTATSEYAKNKTWCWENFINLIGDVAGLLKELRFIFEKIPALFAGNLNNKAGQAKLLTKYTEAAEKYTKELAAALRAKYGLSEAYVKESGYLLGTQEARARGALESWVNNYNELGGVLSKGYMTAVTVGDTYGEAKAAGASDIDATLLTLGYAAGEYAILNTGIGEWILPELRANKYRSEAIAKAITGKIQLEAKANLSKFGDLAKNMPKTDKMKWAKDLFNEGKNIANAVYSNGASKGKALIKASVAGGLGEGVEESTEELLADFSKGCYNTVNWLRGEDVRLNSFGFLWENGERTFNGLELFDRYSMSFLGGIVGGSLTNLGTSYNMISYLYTPESAKRELVYMARLGQLDDIRKVVSKMELGNKNLSATEFLQVGELQIPMPGTPKNNQDLYIKKAVNLYLDFIENTLNAEGLNLSNDDFINKALGDVRYQQLYNSITAVSLLEDFNQLNTDIITAVDTINTLEKKKKDINGDNVVSDKENRAKTLTAVDYDKQIKELLDIIKEKKKLLDELVSGKNAAIYAGLALVEMIPVIHENILPISFPLFVKSKYGKEYNQLSDADKIQAHELFKSWKNMDKDEQVRYATATFMDIIQNFSSTLLSLEKAYKSLNVLLLNVVDQLTNIYKNLYSSNEAIENSSIALSQAALYDAIAPAVNTDLYNQAVQLFNDKINSIDSNLPLAELDLLAVLANQEFKAEVKNIVETNIFDLANKFILLGFINNDVKRLLSSILKTIINFKSTQNSEYELDDDADPKIVEENKQKLKELELIKKNFDNLGNTPFEANLNLFAISILEKPTDFNQLLSIVDNMLEVNKKDMSALDMSETLSQEIDNAIRVIQLYLAAIYASRVDSDGIDNIWGFSKTINEIAEKTGNPINLAEINKDFADLLSADLDNIKSKLLFVKAQYNHNLGNKLVELEKTSANFSRIAYNKIKSIFLVLDDDDDELKLALKPFQDLISNLSSFSILEKISATLSYALSSDEKKLLQLEITAIDDAIYNLFNSDYFKNSENLSKFFNHKRFNVFSALFNEFLNKDLLNINDISTLYYIASRASVKSSDYLSRYADIINPDSGIAPIAPLELAVFTAYANSMNGDRFSSIIKSFNKSVTDFWKGMTEDGRKEFLKQFNSLSEEDINYYASDDNIETFLLGLATAKYDNLSLVEGIAGSGKTSSVFNILYQLIKDKIKTVWITHACDDENLEQAKAILEKLGAEGLLFTKESLLKLICPEYKEDIDNTDYVVKNGRLVSNWNISKDLKDVPPVLFIDEIGKFNAFELSILDKFAKEYGVSVIVAGDFDQTKNKLLIDLGNDTTYTATSKRLDFIHSLKLGISMRTDNGIKTYNNNEFAFLKSRLKKDSKTLEKDITLRYYEAEDGNLYGDKVFNLNSSNYIDLVVEQVKKLINTLDKSKNEKIKYIYLPGSLLDTALNQAGITEYLDRIPENKAQGREARYYIVETSKSGTADPNDQRDILYTGSTRALLGAILVTLSDVLGVKSVETKTLVEEKYKESIPNFTKNRKAILKELYQNPIESVYTPRLKILTLEIPQTEKKTEAPERQVVPSPEPASPIPTAKKVLSLGDLRTKYGNRVDIKGLTINYNNTDIPVELVDIPFINLESEGKTNIVDFNNTPTILVKIGNYYLPFFLSDNGWYPIFTSTGKRKAYYNIDFLELVGQELNNTFGISIEAIKGTSLKTALFITLSFSNLSNELDRINLAKNSISNELSKYSIDTEYNYNSRDIVKIVGDDSLYKIESVNAFSNAPSTYTLLREDGIKKTVKGSDISEVIYSPFMEESNPPVPLGVSIEYNGKEGIIRNISYMFTKGPYVSIEYEDGTLGTVFEENFDKIKEYIPIPDPEFDSLAYNEDSETPNVDISNDLEFKSLIDLLNQEKRTYTPKFVITGDSITFSSLLHSFNMLCPGVVFDLLGKIIPDIATDKLNGEEVDMHNIRIDGVNGLRHIENVLLEEAEQNGDYSEVDSKVWSEVKGVSEKDWYLPILAELLNNILGASTKEEIFKYIKNNLGYTPDFINFAFKTSPNPSQKTRDAGILYFIDSIKRWGKYMVGALETAYFNPSDDLNSDRVIPHRLVAIVGDTKHGEICEIPLLALSNPITIMRALFKQNTTLVLLFKEVADKWDSYGNIKIHEKAKKIVNDFGNNPKYTNLINLFRLFNHERGGLFRINYATDEDNPNNIYRNWLPSNNLLNLGLRLTIDPGKYTEEDHWEIRDKNHDANRELLDKWISIKEFKDNPRFSVSSILISKDSNFDLGNGTTIENAFEAGHEFVLVGTPDLKNDDLLISYYKKQLSDPNAIPKVKLVKILPPVASFLEYLEHIVNKLNKVNDPRSIGHLFTPFQILDILLRNNDIRRWLEEDYWGAANGKEKVKELTNIVKELSDLHSKSRYKGMPKTARKNLLNKLVDKLKHYDEYDGIKMPLVSHLVRTLELIAKNPRKVPVENRGLLGVYPSKFDPEIISKILEILNKANYTIYHKGNRIIQTSKGFPGTPLVKVETDKDGYSLNGNPYRINGKIDTLVFIGDISGLVSLFVSKLNYSDRYVIPSDFSNFKPNQHLKNLTANMLFAKSIIGQDALNALDIVIPLNTNISESELQEYNNKLVLAILDSGLKKIAFHVNGKIKARSWEYEGQPIVTDLDTNEGLYSIDKYKEPDGTYKFLVLSNGIRYTIDFDSNSDNLTITPEPRVEAPAVNTPTESVIDEEAWLLNLENIKALAISDKKRFGILAKATTFTDFMLKINKLKTTPAAVTKLEEVVNGLDESETKLFLQNIINYMKDENNPSCNIGPTIKI